MKLAKRTYSLPSDVVDRFERQLPAENRSSILARLIQDWLDERERVELRGQIIEGCEEMAGVYRDVNAEWDRATK